jgi:O-acetyl-ADP-ribose deacetylase (regulator of RNase III)
MGAGIAVEFRRRWPAMYDAYRAECRSGRLQPGGIFVWQAADRLIVNLATQRGVGRGAARLEWVRQAARATAQLSVAGLALPRIGAGLGGLRWADVRAILDEELAPLPYVELWSLPRDQGA